MSHITRLLLCLAFVTPAVAQETFSWIGQKVIAKYGYPIKIEDRVVPTHGFHVYTVQRTNGDWLWVVSGSVEGWIPSSQVVLFDQAIDFYTQEIRASPGNSGAWGQRGIIWDEKKEYDKAIADYNEAIRLDPKYATAFINRGNAWSNKKEFDKAIADYNEAIRLDPKDVLAYDNRGDAWRAKKEFDKAIADYNEAIRLDPKGADAYNELAWLWATCPDERFRDGKKAVELATRACELTEWKDAEILDTLAADYAELGDFGKAVEWQEKTNKLYTDADDRRKGEERLKLYKEKKPYRETD